MFRNLQRKSSQMVDTPYLYIKDYEYISAVLRNYIRLRRDVAYRSMTAISQCIAKNHPHKNSGFHSEYVTLHALKQKLKDSP